MPTTQRDTTADLIQAACVECLSAPKPHGRKLDEDGTTVVSIHNVHVALREHGWPDLAKCGRPSQAEYALTLTWPDRGVRETFTGFSWGFYGTGPTALVFVLKALGVRTSIDDVAGWHYFDDLGMTIQIPIA